MKISKKEEKKSTAGRGAIFNCLLKREICAKALNGEEERGTDGGRGSKHENE